MLILVGNDVASRNVEGEELPVYRGGNFINDMPIPMTRLQEVDQIASRVGFVRHEEGDKE